MAKPREVEFLISVRMCGKCLSNYYIHDSVTYIIDSRVNYLCLRVVWRCGFLAGLDSMSERLTRLEEV